MKNKEFELKVIKENLIMSKKLKEVKTSIENDCPHYFQHMFVKPICCDPCEKFMKLKQNNYFMKKINDFRTGLIKRSENLPKILYKNLHKKNISQQKPFISFQKIWAKERIEKENTELFRRLIDSKSFFHDINSIYYNCKDSENSNNYTTSKNSDLTNLYNSKSCLNIKEDKPLNFKKIHILRNKNISTLNTTKENKSVLIPISLKHPTFNYETSRVNNCALIKKSLEKKRNKNDKSKIFYFNEISCESNKIKKISNSINSDRSGKKTIDLNSLSFNKVLSTENDLFDKNNIKKMKHVYIENFGIVKLKIIKNRKLFQIIIEPISPLSKGKYFITLKNIKDIMIFNLFYKDPYKIKERIKYDKENNLFIFYDKDKNEYLKRYTFNFVSTKI